MQPIPKWLKNGAGFGAAILALLLAQTVVRTIATGYRQANAFNPTRDRVALPQGPKVEMDKKLPVRVDDITTLIAFDVGASRVRYQYLMDKPAAEIDVPRFQSEMQRTLIEGFCNQPQMEMFRRLNVQMEYSYGASDGAEIANITFTRAVCPTPQ